jgi:hypothetical protein
MNPVDDLFIGIIRIVVMFHPKTHFFLLHAHRTTVIQNLLKTENQVVPSISELEVV